MSAQQRFVLAVVLMLAVLVGGNLLFPPVPPPETEPTTAPAEVADEADQGPGGGPEQLLPESATVVGDSSEAVPPEGAQTDEIVSTDPELPALTPQEPTPTVPDQGAGQERLVTVEGPLIRFTFTNLGGRLVSAELPQFESFTRDGPVELVAPGALGMLGNRIVVEADTVELRTVPFEVTPESGIRLEPGGEPQVLSFRYEHPSEPFAFEIDYTFDPDAYLVRVSGRAQGLNRGLLLTDLGTGLALNEADERTERANVAYVVNHLQEGIRDTSLGDIEERRVDEGPLLWAATKSSYFVVGLLPRVQEGDPLYLGGLLAWPLEDVEDRAVLATTQSLGPGGAFDYRFYAGPQDYARLTDLGSGFQDVNPVGWRFLRPVLRPIIAVIMWILVFFHTNLSIGYGWVLILMGVLMRVVLFPLYHKSMRAQLKNMAVQPLLKEIQTKYKDQPEKLQKELMKLYKEHGFNPLAGCWPMLLPWPVLIALFFVFQSTIELRGVPFAWLPDLSASDPIFVLPVLLGLSMFLMQWISMRTLDEVNPQMKMMMWGMPIFMVILFANFPSGLNLYYLTANLATLPQSWWIARERQKVRAKQPPAAAPS